MPNINFLAIAIAAVSTFLLGGLWYSPVLFGPKWQREAGDTRNPKRGHPAKVFGLSFLFALVAAFIYSALIPHVSDPVSAAMQGLAIGAGLVAASFGINYQFANRSTVLWLIDGGYHTLQFGIYGVILGLWR